jgi:hypothetical protein
VPRLSAATGSIAAAASYFDETTPRAVPGNPARGREEEQFYSVWPLVIPVVAARLAASAGVKCAGGIAAASAAAMTLLAGTGDPTRVYYGQRYPQPGLKGSVRAASCYPVSRDWPASTGPRASGAPGDPRRLGTGYHRARPHSVRMPPPTHRGGWAGACPRLLTVLAIAGGRAIPAPPVSAGARLASAALLDRRKRSYVACVPSGIGRCGCRTRRPWVAGVGAVGSSARSRWPSRSSPRWCPSALAQNVDPTWTGHEPSPRDGSASRPRPTSVSRSSWRPWLLSAAPVSAIPVSLSRADPGMTDAQAAPSRGGSR